MRKLSTLSTLSTAIVTLFLSVVMLSAQVKTRVTGTLYNTNGTTTSGYYTVSWKQFQANDGTLVDAGKTSSINIYNGLIDISLIPTYSALQPTCAQIPTPTGVTACAVSYTIDYYLQNAVHYTEYWVVPLTGPTTVAAVRTTPAPLNVYAFGPQGPPPVFQGTWSSATNYALDDIVFYNNNSYASTTNNNLNSNPASGIPWRLVAVGINFIGAWSNVTTYSVGQAVSYLGSSYLSLLSSNLNNTPGASPTYWSLLSQAGSLTAVNTLTGPTLTVTYSDTPATTGFTSTASTITLQMVDATNSVRGLVNTGVQSFRGDKTFTSSTNTNQTYKFANGTLWHFVNPSANGDPNDAQGLFLRMSTDSTTTNPNFSDQNLIETYMLSNGGKNMNGGSVKTTFFSYLNNAIHYGAGQRFVYGSGLQAYGAGDAFTYSDYQHCWGPLNDSGAEGCGISIKHLYQGSFTGTSATKATGVITSSVQTTCDTTLTQAVTKLISAQTVTVASTTGCVANDWISVRPLNPTIGSDKDIVKITAVGSGTITAIFSQSHSSGEPVKPAVTLTLNGTASMGQLRWMVDTTTTPITAGTISSISSLTVNGSGTNWTIGMLGGSVASGLYGCISFDADTTYGVRAWFPITGVASTTQLTIWIQAVTGLVTYKGLAPTYGNGYQIAPCDKLYVFGNSSEFQPGNVTVLGDNGFTWTVGDTVEASYPTSADVSGESMQLYWLLPSATLRHAHGIANYGRTFGFGYQISSQNATAISAATNSNPVVFTVATAPDTGTVITLVRGAGTWLPINGTRVVTKISSTTFSVPVDSTSFGTSIESLGYLPLGDGFSVGLDMSDSYTGIGIVLGPVSTGFGIKAYRNTRYGWVDSAGYLVNANDGVQINDGGNGSFEMSAAIGTLYTGLSIIGTNPRVPYVSLTDSGNSTFFKMKWGGGMSIGGNNGMSLFLSEFSTTRPWGYISNSNSVNGIYLNSSADAISGTNYGTSGGFLSMGSYWTGSAAQLVTFGPFLTVDTGTNPAWYWSLKSDAGNDPGAQGNTLLRVNQQGETRIGCSSGAHYSCTNGTVTLNVAGITTGQNRTITSPNYTGTWAMFVGTITTTASASDALTVTGVSTSSTCGYAATNSTAATLTGLYITPTANTVTLSHSATSGATFSIYCGGQ